MCRLVPLKDFYELGMIRYFAIITALVLTTVSATAGNSGLKTLAKSGLREIWSAVGRLTLDGGQGFCTASLIAPDIVLTAAHCLYDEQTGAQYATKDFEFQAGWRNGRAEAFRKVKSILAHPKYHFESANSVEKVSHDIAVIMLDQPIQSQNIRPFVVTSLPHRGAGVLVVAYVGGLKDVPFSQSLCKVKAKQNEILVLTCDVDYGASGAPVFVISEGVAKMISLISAMTWLDDKKMSLGVSLEDALIEFADLVRHREFLAPSVSSND